MRHFLYLFVLVGFVGAANATTTCSNVSTSLGKWLALNASLSSSDQGGTLQIVDANSKVVMQKSLWEGKRGFDTCSFEFPQYYNGTVERARGIVAFTLRLTTNQPLSTTLISFVGRKNADGSLTLFEVGDSASADLAPAKTVEAVGPLIADKYDDKHLVVYEVVGYPGDKNGASFQTIDFTTNTVTEGVDSPINPCAGVVYMPPAYDFEADYGTAGDISIRSAYNHPGEQPSSCESEYAVSFDPNKVVVGYTRVH